MTASPRALTGAARARVGFLTSHPFQYSSPLYKYLARSEKIEPVALYLSDFSLRGSHDKQFGREIKWDVDLLGGYEHHFIGKNYQTAEPYGFLALRGDRIRQRLAQLRLDALVVHGHNFLGMLQAMVAAHQHGIPLLYKGETHLLLPRSKIKAGLRRPVMSWLYARMDGFLAISQRNRDFYRSLGVPDEKIFDYPYTVENDRFVATSTLTPDERLAMRAELGLDPALPVITFASKFMPRKHPGDVIAAAALLAARGVQSQVLFVGTGELEDELHAQVARHPELPVVFAGFRNQSELPRILGASDIFVLPSEDEPFGLIVNEAMCAGLAIVASEEIGCVPDLVHQDTNGRVFDAGDVAGLADALEPLIRQPDLRERMGRTSREMIEQWGFARNLAGLEEAIARLLK